MLYLAFFVQKCSLLSCLDIKQFHPLSYMLFHAWTTHTSALTGFKSIKKCSSECLQGLIISEKVANVQGTLQKSSRKPEEILLKMSFFKNYKKEMRGSSRLLHSTGGVFRKHFLDNFQRAWPTEKTGNTQNTSLPLSLSLSFSLSYTLQGQMWLATRSVFDKHCSSLLSLLFSHSVSFTPPAL